MAKDKTSFVLYTNYLEVFEELSDNDAGKLAKHLFRYVNDLSPTPQNARVKLAFITIKQQLKRDLEKYEIKRKQWSDAGKASAKARSTKSTDVKSRSTDSTVNVNDSVNVNDNVFKKRELQFKKDVYKLKYKKETLESFFDYWSEPNKSGTKMKFEQESTWDLSRRLKRWSNNNFNKVNEKDTQPKITIDR